MQHPSGEIYNTLHQGTLYVDGWRVTLNSIVKTLVVGYPLVVSYPQQYHLAINELY